MKIKEKFLLLLLYKNYPFEFATITSHVVLVSFISRTTGTFTVVAFDCMIHYLSLTCSLFSAFKYIVKCFREKICTV